MARTPGARNRDFGAKRAALLDTLTDYALTAELQRPSLRQFAMAADITEPTLRHYFTDRQGVVIAILKTIGQRSRTTWEQIALPAAGPADALAEFFQLTADRMQQGGFIRAHGFGLVEGAACPQAGRAYLNHVLEPSLGAIIRKLSATPGCPREPDALRAAALAALSPVIVMSLHQELLGGEAAVPLNRQQVMAHLEGWLGAGLSSRTRPA